MSTHTLKLLAKTALTNSGPDTVYTVPSSTTTMITYMSITNTSTTTTRTVDVKAGPSGSTKTWRKSLTLAPGQTVEFVGVFILETTQILTMNCSTGTDIEVLVCGDEVT